MGDVIVAPFEERVFLAICDYDWMGESTLPYVVSHPSMRDVDNDIVWGTARAQIARFVAQRWCVTPAEAWKMRDILSARPLTGEPELG